MNEFKKRLYNHYIYCNNLYNVCNDLASDLEEKGFNLTPNKYSTGKYYNWHIDNNNEEFEEVLEYIIRVRDPEYYSDVRYYIEEDVIKFFIEI